MLIGNLNLTQVLHKSNVWKLVPLEALWLNNLRAIKPKSGLYWLSGWLY